MRASGLLVSFLIVLAAAGAGADSLRVNREQLSPDPSTPDALAFTLDVKTAGSYAAQLTAQAEQGKKVSLLLSLQPEGSAAATELRFSFTGRGCG